MEHRLRDSEVRYRRLFETAQDGILILDAKTGQITDVNPFLVDMLGYSKNEFFGQEALGGRLARSRIPPITPPITE